MSNTKGTALTAITNGTFAPATDIGFVVDISDTTMAASGTDKKATLEEQGVFFAQANCSPTADRTIQAGYSQLVVGPYIIGSGVLVTIGSGGVLAVL